MIDLHCHVDLYPDPVAVLDEAERRGTFVLAVTTTPKAWRGTRKLIGERRRVRVGLGLHPELVAERHGEAALLCALLPEARYVGEIGMDGSPPHRHSLELQRIVFRRVLAECARLGGRVLSIHSRGAADEVLDAIEAQRDAGLAILHWFSGTPRQLARAVELGCWFSVGPAMVRSAKGRSLVARMPADRLLTETDAPFARSGDRPLYPWEATDCAPALADALAMTPENILPQLRRNLKSMAEWAPSARVAPRPWIVP